MCYFGSISPKRTILWSTGPAIRAFQVFETMSREDFEFDPKNKTTETYINARGEKAYKGSNKLKSTQFLGSIGLVCHQRPLNKSPEIE